MSYTNQFENARLRAIEQLKQAGIALTELEKKNIEIVDFGLGNLEVTGLEIITYVNTDRCCAKELVLFPGQTCPEHRHPEIDGLPGKEETFRCRSGEIFLYIPGEPTKQPRAVAPNGHEHAYTVWNEVHLLPGEQYTLAPDTLHWFQAGSKGAIVSEFSTKSRDEADIFTDKEIQRV